MEESEFWPNEHSSINNYVADKMKQQFILISFYGAAKYCLKKKILEQSLTNNEINENNENND